MEFREHYSNQGSSFLPFYDLEPRLERSIKLIELMDSLSQNSEPTKALATILRSTLAGFSPTQAFLLAPHVGAVGEKWSITAHYDQLGAKQHLDLHLEPEHPLVAAVSAGNICITRTNGDPFEFNPIKNSRAESKADGQFVDSQQLLVIPLMENLVARSALVLVINNQVPTGSQELELLSAVQAIYSFFYFKNQNTIAENFQSAAQQFAFEVFNGLSETQLRIGRLIFQEKTDDEIMDLLGMSQSEFDEDYAKLLEFLMVTTRDEVAAELRVLDLK
jgi:hypothetical protein